MTYFFIVTIEICSTLTDKIFNKWKGKKLPVYTFKKRDPFVPCWFFLSCSFGKCQWTQGIFAALSIPRTE